MGHHLSQPSDRQERHDARQDPALWQIQDGTVVRIAPGWVWIPQRENLFIAAVSQGADGPLVYLTSSAGPSFDADGQVDPSGRSRISVAGLHRLVRRKLDGLDRLAAAMAGDSVALASDEAFSPLMSISRDQEDGPLLPRSLLVERGAGVALALQLATQGAAFNAGTSTATGPALRRVAILYEPVDRTDAAMEELCALGSLLRRIVELPALSLEGQGRVSCWLGGVGLTRRIDCGTEIADAPDSPLTIFGCVIEEQGFLYVSTTLTRRRAGPNSAGDDDGSGPRSVDVRNRVARARASSSEARTIFVEAQALIQPDSVVLAQPGSIPAALMKVAKTNARGVIHLPASLDDAVAAGGRPLFLVLRANDRWLVLGHTNPASTVLRSSLPDLLWTLRKVSHAAIGPAVVLGLNREASSNAPASAAIVRPASPTERIAAGGASETLDASPNWSIDSAHDVVVKRAHELFPAVTSDPAALSEVLATINVDPPRPGRLRELLSGRRGIAADDFLSMARGEYVAALLVAESELERRLEAQGSADADPAIFGSALTTVISAHAQLHEAPHPYSLSRVLNLTTEWILRRPGRPYRPSFGLVLRHLTAGTAPGAALRELLPWAPWLTWFLDSRKAWGLLARVDESQFIDALILARPNVKYVTSGRNAASAVVSAWPVTWEEIDARFGVPKSTRDQVQGDDELSRLCQLLETIYHRPGHAATMLQTFPNLASLGRHLEERISRIASTSSASLDDLLVLTDGAASGASVIAVNTARTRRLTVAIAGSSYRLEFFAPEQQLAAAYAVGPFEVSQDFTFTVDAQTYSGNVSPRATGAETFTENPSSPRIATLFRGRTAQLERLAAGMRPGLMPRPAQLIFGPRRAGKTTLALRACAKAVEVEAIRGYIFVDLHAEPDGSQESGYSQRLAEIVRRKLRRSFGLEIPDVINDIRMVLEEADELLNDPVAVILDEFDTLIARAPDSPLYQLALRLGATQFTHLSLIGTAQRFHKVSADLKGWAGIECPIDLTWNDGLTYFAEPLRIGSATLPRCEPIVRPFVMPATFRDAIASRVGLRPYFWGQIRGKLDAALWQEPGGSAVFSAERLRAVIDQMLDEEDPYLALMLIPTSGLSATEIRRQDLFSVEEIRILNLIAEALRDGQRHVPKRSASKAGTAVALADLIERGIASERHDQIALSAPIFEEFVSRHAADLEQLATVRV